MAIDPKNPLLNGPRRIDARPILRIFPEPEVLEDAPEAVVAAGERPGVVQVSEEAILAARTPAGAWSRATLAGWGVSWPPPKGWKERLLKGLPQEPPKAAAAAELPLEASGPAERIPHPKSPEFDSTRHGLLAPPRVTYRKLY